MSKKESFTSASVFPSKLLHQKVIDAQGRIIPLHIQLSPTNDCNLSCSFCSCSDRDKKKSLTLEQVMKVLDVCADRGTKAITWTGGGSPLMHSQINEMLKYAGQKGMKSGLVTNGILLGSKLEHHKNLTWCRISSSDDRKPFYPSIEVALEINPQTDWAFSHVLSRRPDYKGIANLVDFANEHDFTHVRLVSDLLDLGAIPEMREVQSRLVSFGVDDSRVIYQGRKDHTPGTEKCYISLLKPVIAPEGIFPCCGVQYSIHGQPHDMIDMLKMGEIDDLPKILDQQLYFHGQICDRCYYGLYNDALDKLLDTPKHQEFV